MKEKHLLIHLIKLKQLILILLIHLKTLKYPKINFGGKILIKSCQFDSTMVKINI